ncbi:stage II sporulation protein M [Effusibacillus lacus]|uniref:Stage II sporulation protein M n=1 Tax=Effusibacillus lacus TaxID=1348429 RepID=A0A292YIU0_9BACL|nr:stage II sporulation protein M [Effusibacillus lacus]TCS68523.1 stage II sporulation protein M [Effusibacillus lacus]GAX88405.1 hypothetical protein EFBL_0014 [Effusibacillus lacus]
MKPFAVIRKNLGYLGFAFSLFVLGLLIGVIYFESLHELAKQFLQHIEKIADKAKNGGSMNLSWLLLKNNVIASLVLLIGGFFLSIFTIYGLVMNGLVVGYALVLMGKTAQVPIWALVAFGILPHGLLEIPAFLLSGAMGIKLGYMWLRPLPGRSRWRSVLYTIRESLYVLPVILALLLTAAVIEGFVTPILLKWYVQS